MGLGTIGAVFKRLHRIRFRTTVSGELARKPGFEPIWLANQWLVAKKSGPTRLSEARARNYELVRDALESHGVPLALLSQHPMRTHVIAVPDEFWSQAMDALAELGRSDALYASLPATNWRKRSVRDAVLTGSPRFVSSVSDEAVVTLFPMRLPCSGGAPVGGRYACVVQRWVPNEDSTKLVAPAANETANYVSAKAFDSLVESVDLFGIREVRFESAPRPHTGLVNFPIDLVYLWVDGNDPAWQASRKAVSDSSRPGKDAAGAWLFRDRNELMYSIRSVELYAPWVNKIHLLTADQVPPWLDTGSDQIEVHSHRQVFSDPDALPTFNSHAIGSQVHRIPGLSEHYLIMNDDVFFAAPVEPEHFFTASGLARIRRSKSHAPLAPRGEMNTIENARLNSAELIRDKFGVLPTQLFAHTPVAQLRSYASALEEEFSAEYASTARSRFRRATDFETNSWLQLNALEQDGRATDSYLRYAYLYLSGLGARDKLEGVLNSGRVQVVCLNDGPDDGEVDYSDELARVLRSAFPEPSKFELDAEASPHGTATAKR